MPLDEDALRAAHPNRALVHLTNNDALVWDVRDVKLLRTQHNIIGLMTGTLPLAPQQNVLLGLPMQLIPEEVTYLLRVGAVVLINHSALEREGLGPGGSSSEGAHVQTALPGSIWSFPETQGEKARCAVFDDLHARGYFLGTGLRFGGEFVVYPGDPLRYHSHFSTSVLAHSEEEGGMSGLDFVASGRLGTAVKKAHLICAVDTDLCEEGEGRAVGGQEEGESGGKFEEGGLLEGRTTWGRVRYYSLTWSGFGT